MNMMRFPPARLASWVMKRSRHRQLHRKGQALGGLQRGEQVVLLIDEIDKADIEFPNDLLQELDRMEFFVYETGETVKAEYRPIVIITQTTKKSCRTRSCAGASSTTSASRTRHDAEIVDVHFPEMQTGICRTAMEVFFDLREVPG